MTPVPRTALLDRVADWQARGLIDPETAARLTEDIGEGRGTGIGFQRFIVLAGVLCLAFAAITFVASNWDVFPRPLRLGLILGALWMAWCGGLLAARANRPWLAETLFLLASAVYGAGLALVAQLYHIQGTAPGFVFAWALGVLIAAGLTRSKLVLALGIGLITTWHLMVIDTFLGLGSADINPTFLGLWVICAGLGWWFGGALAANLLAISLMIWWISAIDSLLPNGAELPVTIFTAFTLMALALGALAHGLGRGAARVALHYTAFLVIALALLGYANSDKPGAMHWAVWLAAGLAGTTSLALAMRARARRAPEAYELWVNAAAIGLAIIALMLAPHPLLQAAYALALAIWTARMGYRLELPVIRFLGMAGFLVGLMAIYGETVGSLIGTAGFYLGAGIVLLAGAWISTRLHRAGADAEGRT